MQPDEIEKIELELFLEAIYQRYGYDFRHYARASARRRARHILTKSGCKNISELIPLLLHNEEFAQKAVHDFSITVTEMFRDPDFYRAVRQTVTPYLQTYPFIKIWVAGCATGEEVYSLAILLKEEGIYDRVTIYATDFNEIALKKAAEGIYPLKDVQQYTGNYQKSGGVRSFSDYYHAEYNSAIMNASLKTNITFASHNLATESVFSEVQVVFCRNVLIYFDRTLQNWALNTLANSLSRGGFLCLGTKETLEFSSVFDQFKAVVFEQRIYQKRTT
ncbi:MAG: protein-glutamate O-methyltransferase CheR [Anaerolineales bacterium]